MENTSGFSILRKVTLSRDQVSTGKTVHISGGEELHAPSKLQITQYPDDKGYYLIYLDSSGDEMTDTYHDTIEEAMEQAKWEFNVTVDDWEIVD